MRAHQFLLREYSRDITAQKLGTVLLQKFRKEPKQWQERVTGAVTDYDDHALQYLLELVEKADPTKNKQYVPWIIRTYVNSPSLKFEDAISKVTEPLTKFFKLVNKKQIPAPDNDIGRIKDLARLVQVVDQYPDIVDEPKDVNRGKSKEYYEDKDLRIIIPEDEAAACYYGQGTKWCTASTSAQNMFDRYNKSGEMYIIIPKKPAYTGEKYQFHFPTKQFMDEKDHRANLTALRERFPQLADIFARHSKAYNILALDKEITDLPAAMRQALPLFNNMLKTLIMRDSRRVVYEMSKELGAVVKVFKNSDEIIDLIEDLFDDKTNDLVVMAANILRNDPDSASDEDQLHDLIANDLTDIVRDTELWYYCTEILEELGDEEAEFDVAMTIEGELNSMLQSLIPAAFADAIKSMKSSQQ